MARQKRKKRSRRSFTGEFKKDAVEYVRKSGKTIAEAARDLELTESALRNWVMQAFLSKMRNRLFMRTKSVNC